MEQIRYNSLEVRLFGNQKVNSVSLRELYLDLGYRESNFAAWAKRKLEDKFVEIRDWNKFSLGTAFGVKGRKKIDYMITLDVAKHITASVAKPRSKIIYDYFVEVDNGTLLVQTDKDIGFDEKPMSIDELIILSISDDEATSYIDEISEEERENISRKLDFIMSQDNARDLQICGFLDDFVNDLDIDNHDGFIRFVEYIEDNKIVFLYSDIKFLIAYCLYEKMFMLPIWVQVKMRSLCATH